MNALNSQFASEDNERVERDRQRFQESQLHHNFMEFIKRAASDLPESNKTVKEIKKDAGIKKQQQELKEAKINYVQSFLSENRTKPEIPKNVPEPVSRPEIIPAKEGVYQLLINRAGDMRRRVSNDLQKYIKSRIIRLFAPGCAAGKPRSFKDVIKMINQSNLNLKKQGSVDTHSKGVPYKLKKVNIIKAATKSVVLTEDNQDKNMDLKSEKPPQQLPDRQTKQVVEQQQQRLQDILKEQIKKDDTVI